MDPYPFSGMAFPFGIVPGMSMMLPMFPLPPMLPMGPVPGPAAPFAGPTQPIMPAAPPMAAGLAAPEVPADIRRTILQSQKQQLTQTIAYLTEYVRQIDEALTRIDEEGAQGEKVEGKKP
jgi:hypothetical protein